MRIGLFALLLAVAGSSAGVATAQETPAASVDIPRTEGSLEPEEGEFRFVIVGDRTGGHRPGVFADAMVKLELLQPDFIVTVGDQIEGYTEDEAEINRQWDEFEQRISRLTAPIFFIAGNHDYSNETMARIWRERRGAPYWSFVHKNVLFIGISTEDPPVIPSQATLESTRRLEQAMASDPEGTQQRLLEAVKARGGNPALANQVAISEDQVEFVRRALADHVDARWTFLLMHKPAGHYGSEPFMRIEEMLGDRQYTVIAGHEHYYRHDTYRGRDYIRFGTTGGLWLKDGPGKLDHFALVTMTGKGPVIANLRIDGIFPVEGPPDPAAPAQSAPTTIPDGGEGSSDH